MAKIETGQVLGVVDLTDADPDAVAEIIRVDGLHVYSRLDRLVAAEKRAETLAQRDIVREAPVNRRTVNAALRAQGGQ